MRSCGTTRRTTRSDQHGLTIWTDASLSTPTTSDNALQIGRSLLAEFNQVKGPGTINIVGEVMDRQGNRQPAWKIRATDTIAVTNFENDRPRLVTETAWSQDSKTMQVTVDSTVKRVDAFLDRISMAVGASNISA